MLRALRTKVKLYATPQRDENQEVSGQAFQDNSMSTKTAGYLVEIQQASWHWLAGLLSDRDRQDRANEADQAIRTLGRLSY